MRMENQSINMMRWDEWIESECVGLNVPLDT